MESGPNDGRGDLILCRRQSSVAPRAPARRSAAEGGRRYTGAAAFSFPALMAVNNCL